MTPSPLELSYDLVHAGIPIFDWSATLRSRLDEMKGKEFQGPRINLVKSRLSQDGFQQSRRLVKIS